MVSYSVWAKNGDTVPGSVDELARMYAARAFMAGREYHGRTFGHGMSIVLRETVASKRARGIAQ